MALDAHGRPPGNSTVNTATAPVATTLRVPGQQRIVFMAVLAGDGKVWERIKGSTWSSWSPIIGGNPPAFKELLGASAYLRGNGKIPSINLFARDAAGNVHTADYGPFGGMWSPLGR